MGPGKCSFHPSILGSLGNHLKETDKAGKMGTWGNASPEMNSCLSSHILMIYNSVRVFDGWIFPFMGNLPRSIEIIAINTQILPTCLGWQVRLMMLSPVALTVGFYYGWDGGWDEICRSMTVLLWWLPVHLVEPCLEILQLPLPPRFVTGADRKPWIIFMNIPRLFAAEPTGCLHCGWTNCPSDSLAMNPVVKPVMNDDTMMWLVMMLAVWKKLMPGLQC